jgi:hypothetical protein
MKPNTFALLIAGLLLMPIFAGCGGSSASDPPAASSQAALSAANINLIFVSSEDLANHADGDINLTTANLTDQGLRRSLMMGRFLQRRVLGMQNVTGIYTLEPMTHTQTANNYPDIAAVETIEQFALLNQITLSSAMPPQFVPYTGNSYPLNASYAPGSVPAGVATPSPYCPNCQGLDFNDGSGNNEILVSGIISTGVPGFYVFSAPWETTSALMANVNTLQSYNLSLPATYQGPNYIYAITIAPSGSASLITYNSNLHPASTYPAPRMPKAAISAQCTAQKPFTPINVTIGEGGASKPNGINANETLYIVRHGDAHPLQFWSDGNLICAGQWRALDIPNALRGKINPTEVYSVDPAQTSPGTEGFSWSSVVPALTVEPYAIANNLPYNLAASFSTIDTTGASNYFFTNLSDGRLANKTALLGYAYVQIPEMVNALIASYYAPAPSPQTVPDWPADDYDTMWTVKLDADSNLSVDNSMCEGIDSDQLPATCPQF